MNYWKTAIKRALLGIPLGIAIATTIQLIITAINWDMTTPEHYTTLAYYITAYVTSGIIGATFAGTTIIFEIDSWSIIKQIIIHLIITSTVFIGCAIINKWTDTDFVSLAIYIGVFIVIYIIMFISIHQHYKKKIKKINEQLNN